MSSILDVASRESSTDEVNSATLDLAYVAAGTFDIWWEGGCWEW